MWTFETTGKGRKSVVLSAQRETEKYHKGDIVDCDGFIGGILAFKQGETSRSHEVQLLEFEKQDDELLATSLAKWYSLDAIQSKIDKSSLQIRRAIDHHRRNKDLIEPLPVQINIESEADLKQLQQLVRELFMKPTTPKKRQSPRKFNAKPIPVLQLSSYDSDGGSDDGSTDEELELVPKRKRKQKQPEKLELKLAAATLDSPKKTPSQRKNGNVVKQEKPSQEEEPPTENMFNDVPEDEDDDEDDDDDNDAIDGIEEKYDVQHNLNSQGQKKAISFVTPKVVPTLIDRAIAELHPASDPITHLCRDTQFDQLFIALESAIAAKTGTCIYVSGTPGTGKTSIIREVIAQLDLRVRENELEAFKFLEINGMKLVHPNAAYEHLWNVLGRGQMAASNAMTALEAAFTADEPTSKRGVIVLLLDEMDQLVTKGQQLMYNFFNWPSLPHSRLIVIAVANTMDLPERILSNKISSRVGLTRLQFPGYTHTQLKEIVMQRLDPEFLHLIEGEAIEYATRKVAGVGGDARRVLEFVRQALTIAANELPVKTSHVRDVIVNSQTSPLATFIKTLGLATKVLLCAILARIRRTDNIEAPLHDVLKQAAQFVKSASNSDRLVPYLYPGRSVRLAYFQSAVMELVESGLLVQQAIKGEATPKVRLMLPVSVVRSHLEFDPDVKGMI